MKRNSKKKGFTLIELIVVIAILGILAMIAVPRLGGFSENAKQASDKQAAAIVANAGAMYLAQNAEKDVSSVTITDLTNAELITTDDIILKSKKYGPGKIGDSNISVGSDKKVTVTIADYSVSK